MKGRSPRRLRDSNGGDGFTLVELMIVVAIVVILTAVATVAYQRHLRSGRLVAAQELVSQIQAREETYYQQFGHYADVSKTGDFYPALVSPEPQAKQWTAPPDSWKDLGARPSGNATYFSYLVRASNPSATPPHPLDATAATLRIPGQPAAPMTPHAWYYVIAHGDMDGDATYTNGGCSGPSVARPLACTVITATSADSSIIVRNAGE